MLSIKNQIKVRKLNYLVRKRDKALLKGDYKAATEYGKKVDACIIDTLNEEYGL